MKLGKAFSDNLIIESKRETRRDDGDDSWWVGSGRALLFTTSMFLALFILAWRLFDLTIIKGHGFRALADGNRTRELVRHAPRGRLLDRTGKPLVENVPQYRVIEPCEKGVEGCTTYISQEEGERLSKSGLPAGTFLEVDFLRRYLYPEALAHLAGYTGEITDKELKDEYYTLRKYRAGDRLGRMGAEAVYEERLRGRDGRELVEVDASGTMLRTLGRDKEAAGEDITLSIDANLARVASGAFPAGARGAVIVTKPATGEILALYSSPSFDPNAFSKGLSQAQFTSLFEDPDEPMFNRAIGGVYPPGSTFKIITSIAALEEGAITKGKTVEDTGVVTIGPFSFANWYFTQYGKTEGLVDVVKALQRSNDIFFYRAGEWTGITKLSQWARTLGVGNPLGIELSGEAAGLMPDPAWKNQQFNTPEDKEARHNEWYMGDTYHVSIGQGYLLTTPLQVNAWTNVVANGGKLCEPTIEKYQPSIGRGVSCKDLGIKKDTLAVITEGMKRACDPGGTGWPLFNFRVVDPQFRDEHPEASPSASSYTSVPVACKTGTAEFGDPKNHTHAWFTAFAPLPSEAITKEDSSEGKTIIGEPEISVTVLVEGAGEGSSVAAPIAKKILEEWFGR